MKNETLSDKQQDSNNDTDFVRFAYLEEDVKEFIKQIKNGFVAYGIKPEDVSMIIDQVAGDNLT